MSKFVPAMIMAGALLSADGAKASPDSYQRRFEDQLEQQRLQEEFEKQAAEIEAARRLAIFQFHVRRIGDALCNSVSQLFD